MRVTKKTLAAAINTWLDKVQMPYSVLPEDIERTYFPHEAYESGATLHNIVGKHKTDSDYSDIFFYTMQTMRSMQDELNKIEGSIITVKNYGANRHIMDYWIVID
jgi:hypothetical protein